MHYTEFDVDLKDLFENREVNFHSRCCRGRVVVLRGRNCVVNFLRKYLLRRILFKVQVISNEF